MEYIVKKVSMDFEEDAYEISCLKTMTGVNGENVEVQNPLGVYTLLQLENEKALHEQRITCINGKINAINAYILA